MPKKWTEEEMRYLTLLRERGLEVKVIAWKLSRTESSVKHQIRKLGIVKRTWSKQPYKVIHGQKVTPEHIRTAKQHGITLSGIKHRLAEGLSVEDAINTPPKYQRMSDEISDMELVKIVGRIKYINKTEKEFPLPVPKPLIRRLQEKGLTVEEIKPVEVKA